MTEELKPEEVHTCSFCGKPNTDKSVRFMVAGPEANICDSCIDICLKIRDERNARKEGE